MHANKETEQQLMTVPLDAVHRYEVGSVLKHVVVVVVVELYATHSRYRILPNTRRLFA